MQSYRYDTLFCLCEIAAAITPSTMDINIMVVIVCARSITSRLQQPLFCLLFSPAHLQKCPADTGVYCISACVLVSRCGFEFSINDFPFASTPCWRERSIQAFTLAITLLFSIITFRFFSPASITLQTSFIHPSPLLRGSRPSWLHLTVDHLSPPNLWKSPFNLP